MVLRSSRRGISRSMLSSMWGPHRSQTLSAAFPGHRRAGHAAVVPEDLIPKAQDQECVLVVEDDPKVRVVSV